MDPDKNVGDFTADLTYRRLAIVNLSTPACSAPKAKHAI
jgi:hypothetical protein